MTRHPSSSLLPPPSSLSYQLLDFGQGRKLERFGEWVLDRPSPAAADALTSQPSLWPCATARYERTNGDHGEWRVGRECPVTKERELPLAEAGSLGDPSRPWVIRHANLVLELKLTRFGHVGVFPEQAANWDWTSEQVARAKKPIKVLNLFAYTGAGTLSAAAAGAEVVHVDAASNTVAWARHNAELSGLQGAPIRWIVEDAATFVRRELKRGNRYHAVILDPPSYGHGPKGEPWKIAAQLPDLLAGCAELTRDDRRFMLLTCHSPEFPAQKLERMLAQACSIRGVESREMALTTDDGRRLPSGACARWTVGGSSF